MAIIRKIAAVSYLNTIPFIYGIESRKASLNTELVIASPAECARLFMDGEVDVALLPTAVLPQVPDCEVVSSYCIGAEGAVRSVVLVSDEPIDKVERIYVDAESRTSVQLGAYLAKNLWKIEPEWYVLDSAQRMNSPKDGDAFLLIGDKVFEYEGEFEYTYDLSLGWYSQTNLPFAFAVWVARKGFDEEFLAELDHALTFGVEHIYEAILELRGEGF
ncbi:MAG: menaquinone biosynthesis protein, partial [Rikenellaceae bacterium]